MNSCTPEHARFWNMRSDCSSWESAPTPRPPRLTLLRGGAPPCPASTVSRPYLSYSETVQTTYWMIANFAIVQDVVSEYQTVTSLQSASPNVALYSIGRRFLHFLAVSDDEAALFSSLLQIIVPRPWAARYISVSSATYAYGTPLMTSNALVYYNRHTYIT